MSDNFHIRLPKNTLSKALSHIHNIVERRNINSIQFNVRIIAKTNGEITLTTADNILTASEIINGEVISPGAITTPAITLFDIVRKVEDKELIDIALDQQKMLNIKTPNSKFLLPILPVAEFACITADDFTHQFTIASIQLKTLLDHAKIGICMDEHRYNLAGVNLRYNNSLQIASLDGHRLCIDETAITTQEDFPNIILPKKTVIELSKILDDFDNEVRVSLNNRKIQFELASVCIISKLTDGRFPDYNGLIPKEHPLWIIADRKELSIAIDRVNTVLDEKNKGIKLTLRDNTLTISSNNKQSNSQATEQLNVNSNIESTFEIGFNARYLQEGLDAIKEDQVKISLKDSFQPGMVESTKQQSFKYILMPMRV